MKVRLYVFNYIGNECLSELDNSMDKSDKETMLKIYQNCLALENVYESPVEEVRDNYSEMECIELLDKKYNKKYEAFHHPYPLLKIVEQPV